MSAGIPREIRQVREALKKEFSGLVDMSDAQGSAENVEQHFLSRALAALTVRRVLGCDGAEAAAAVVDGRRDTGVDAVAVADSGLHIWLIQSKWSDKGNGRFGIAEALKLVEGLHLIDLQKFDRFNTKVQGLSDRIRAAWGHPNCTVTLLVVTMGSNDLHPDVIERFEQAKEEFNGFSETLGYEHWNGQRVWEIIRDDQAEPSLQITAKMDEWIHLAEPFEAYQGRVPVSEIAHWYDVHQDRLFEQNIRKSLGLTKVNQGLVDTLTTDPQDFWYFNNGITVLCDTAERHSWSKAAHSPIELHLRGASVVNGAQTVEAVHVAMQRDSVRAYQAYVTVKVIVTKNQPAGFGVAVTRATNTQNHVVPRDFVALDPVQWAIRQDFRLSLRKDYTFKRGEPDPAPNAGCSVFQAALALACAHSNPDFAVRAKQNSDLLWEESGTGAYTILFKEATPGACQIWRSVLTLRQVQAALNGGQAEHEGRARSVADYGELIITHLVFRRLDTEGIDDIDFDWDEVLAQVPDLTGTVLQWLIHFVDMRFGVTSYISSTFTNRDRCRLLVSDVLAALDSGSEIPELPAEYQPPASGPRGPRRRNAVPTLVDAGTIVEGEAIEFLMTTGREREAIGPWLAADQRRSRATWVNHRTKPLLWSYDGQAYSPTGLVMKIWKDAGWADHPSAVQGPDRWTIPGQGTLWEIAIRVQDEEEPPDPDSD